MKLFVAGLPLDLDDNQLHDIFSDYGRVKSAKVAFNREAQVSKGFGFVEFSEPVHGEAAIKALDGENVEGKILTVRMADDKSYLKRKK